MVKTWLDINNRDIRFRIFDKPSQKMYYLTDDNQLVFRFKDGEYIFDVVETRKIPLAITDDEDNHNVSFDYNSPDCRTINVSVSDNLNGYLMQYTGYKDIDNVDIYEGDILTKEMLGKKIFYEVISHEGSWKVKNKIGDDNYIYNHLATIRVTAKVVGNEYQIENLK